MAVPKPQLNPVLLIQIALYLCSLILSLCIVVPMSMHQDQFKGHCLLFSTGEWQSEDGQFLVNWASQAYCNFIIFVSVITFVFSASQTARLIKFAIRGRDSSFFSAFIDVLLGAFMSVMTLTAAVFVTCGFKVWCDEITQRFEKCSDATGNDIDKKDSIDSSGFFIQMFTAQFGIWMSFTAWFGLFVFSSVKLCRYHFEENLRVSMAKERKRLINEDLEGRSANITTTTITNSNTSNINVEAQTSSDENDSEQRIGKMNRFRRRTNAREMQGRFQKVTEEDDLEEDTIAVVEKQRQEDEEDDHRVIVKGNQIRIEEHIPDLLT